MSAPNTFADLVFREAYRPKSPLYSGGLQRALQRARHFVLDDPMSAFIADLSTVPFRVAKIRRPGALDSLRHGARLPHPTTWIEFSGRAFRERLLQTAETGKDAWGQKLGGPNTVPVRWGWLLEEHPQMPQAISLHEFIDLGDGRVIPLPFHWVWNTHDEPLPWAADTKAGQLAHGIMGYHTPHIGVVYDHPIPKERLVAVRQVDDDIEVALQCETDTLVIEMGGVVRYAIALLATLNDVPADMTEVKQSRGFVARGAYRKYLDHTVVRLTVPARTDVRRLARKLVAIARHRAHPVRGHWRLYQRGEGVLCTGHDHVWGPAALDPVSETERASCLRCPAWRTWIPSHQRGDAALGFVTHDYAVTHDDHETIN